MAYPANSNPTDITAGPDGNLWFVEQLGNKSGRITPPAVRSQNFQFRQQAAILRMASWLVRTETFGSRNMRPVWVLYECSSCDDEMLFTGCPSSNQVRARPNLAMLVACQTRWRSTTRQGPLRTRQRFRNRLGGDIPRCHSREPLRDLRTQAPRRA